MFYNVNKWNIITMIGFMIFFSLMCVGMVKRIDFLQTMPKNATETNVLDTTVTNVDIETTYGAPFIYVADETYKNDTFYLSRLSLSDDAFDLFVHTYEDTLLDGSNVRLYFVDGRSNEVDYEIVAIADEDDGQLASFNTWYMAMKGNTKSDLIWFSIFTFVGFIGIIVTFLDMKYGLRAFPNWRNLILEDKERRKKRKALSK